MPNYLHTQLIFFESGARIAMSRLIGVEWEFGRVHGSWDPLQNWTGGDIVQDCSCGWEAVTKPMGNNMPSILRGLSSAMDDSMAEVTDRCGLHVHVDGRDMGWSHTLRLLDVYSRVEPLLYIIGGVHRADTEWCKPAAPYIRRVITSPRNKRAMIAAYVLGYKEYGLGDANQLHRWACRSGKKGGARYYGLNLSPWYTGRVEGRSDTTFEFRMHEGTDDVERIISWCHLLRDLVQWSHDADHHMVTSLPASPLRTLVSVVSPQSKEFVLDRVAEWRTTIDRDRIIVTPKGWRFRHAA